MILYCASGRHAALSGKLLQDVGYYAAVDNMGGVTDWAEAGARSNKLLMQACKASYSCHLKLLFPR